MNKMYNNSYLYFLLIIIECYIFDLKVLVELIILLQKQMSSFSLDITIYIYIYKTKAYIYTCIYIIFLNIIKYLLHFSGKWNDFEVLNPYITT